MIAEPLSEIADIVMGQSPPSSTYNRVNNGLPFFQGKADFGDRQPSVRIFCNRPMKIAERGDILISVRAPVGPTNIAPSRCCIGRGLAAIRAKSVDSIFLLHFLRHYEAQLITRGKGSTFEAINRDDLENVCVPIPSFSEQKRIAAILEKADRLRRMRRYARQLNDTFLQSVFLEMFGDPATNSKRWDIEPFQDSLEDIEAGVNFKPVADNESASPWRVLKVSAVTSGEFNAYESKPISPDIVPSKKLIVRNGDFLMSRANTVELVGAVCRVRTVPPMVLLPDKLWRVKFSNQSKLDPDYALILLQSQEMRRRIGSVATGTSGSMKNITQDDAASLLLPIPPLPLQEKFAVIVQRFERLRAQQREAERQAEHLFQTLLHHAFNGEFRDAPL